MKNVIALAASSLVLILSVSAFDCGGNGTPPSPTPTKTATPATEPTATVIPPTETPVPQPIPELIPPFPKVIGMVQLGDMADPIDYNPYNFQSNEATAIELVANGFQAIEIWPNERVMSKDVGKVICNPGIKVIAIRPLSRVSMDAGNCDEDKPYSMTWENADFGQITYDLLKKYGDLSCRGGEPLDIILNNWEIDWQYKGPHCREATPTPYRYQKVTAMLETRQRGVEWGRSEFPDAKLRVLHGIVVNHHEASYAFSASRDVLPDLIARGVGPHVIGFSFYTNKITFAQALALVQVRTGYPVSRIYVAEHGQDEKWVGRQRARFEETLPMMDEAGIRVIFMWTWKQYWPGKYQEDGSRAGGWHGLWEVDENLGVPIQDSFTGRWTTGLEYIQEFRMRFDEPPLPAVEPPVGGATPVPTPTVVPPTATPKPPTAIPTATATPDDPCSECPPPNSIGCTIAYTACVQCWEDCGQPFATPTPGPPTAVPTKTPTSGVIIPTQTPAPGDCSECPAPESIGCIISYPACEQCWSDCGHPLATPTPAATKTPTYSGSPTFTAHTQGKPIFCIWAFKYDATGETITRRTEQCSEISQSFNKAGWWTITLTTHFAHGAEGVKTKPNGDKYGDLDGDGKYEYEHEHKLEVLEKPDIGIYT